MIFASLLFIGLIIWSFIIAVKTCNIAENLQNLPLPTPFSTTSFPITTSTSTQKGQKGQKGSECKCSSSCQRVCCYQPYCAKGCTKGCTKGQEPPVPCQKGQKGEQGLKGDKGAVPQSAPVPGPKGNSGEEGPKGEKGDAGGQKGDKGAEGPKGEEGQKGDAGGQKGEKGEMGADGQKGEPDGEKGAKGQKGDSGMKGSKGEIGYTGQKGEKGETNRDLRMFNWGHSNDEGTLNDDDWDGAMTVAANKQTHHIFDLGAGTYQVTAVMMVDMNQPDQHLYVDEILPANFNSSNITNPMDITFVSVTGEVKVTVAQGTGGDAKQKITFTSGPSDEVIKVIFTVTATEPTCSFWYYRASSNNNKLHLYQVIIEAI